MREPPRLILAMMVGLLACVRLADAANIVANFNEYPSNERLLTTNYGSGWPAGFGTAAEAKWGEDLADGTTGGTSVIQTSSTSGDLIAPPATGYNLTQPVVTAARSVIGTGTAARRQNRATGGLTGDIWMSWLMAPSADARLGLNLNGSVKGFNGADNVRLLAVGSSFNVYYGTTTVSQTNVFTPGTTSLILGLLQVNVSGTSDQLRLWVNPNVGLGEGDVLTNQTPIHDVFLNDATVGDSLNTVGIVAYSPTSSTGYLDALHISNEPTGFTDVTGVVVPEPTTALTLFGICGALAAVALRRR